MTKTAVALALLACCILAQFGCGSPQPNSPPPPALPATPLPAATVASAATPLPPATPLPAPTAAPPPWECFVPAAPPAPMSPLPVSKLILLSDAIARVRITEITQDVEESPLYRAWNGCPSPYIGVAVFKFEVIEWLKGGAGSASVFGVAVTSNGRSAQEAAYLAARYWQNRDTRWDTREAIIFMDNARETVPSTQRPDRYYLGFQNWNNLESYALNAERSWLPLARDAQADGASGNPEYLLEDPDMRASEAVGSTQEVKTLTLTNLKLMLGFSADELRKRVDSQVGYLETNSSIPTETGLASFDAATPVNGGILLIWSPSDNSAILGYRILRRKQTDSAFIQLAEIPATANGYYQDLQDIQPETEYIYRLRAYGATGDIADARIAITTVAELEHIGGATPTPLATPEP